MKDIQDEELDKLFQEAAAGFEAPSDSSTWEQMNLKLDEAAKKPFPTKKIVLTISLILLLLLSYLLVHNATTDPQKTATVKQKHDSGKESTDLPKATNEVGIVPSTLEKKQPENTNQQAENQQTKQPEKMTTYANNQNPVNKSSKKNRDDSNEKKQLTTSNEEKSRKNDFKKKDFPVIYFEKNQKRLENNTHVQRKNISEDSNVFVVQKTEKVKTEEHETNTYEKVTHKEPNNFDTENIALLLPKYIPRDSRLVEIPVLALTVEQRNAVKKEPETKQPFAGRFSLALAYSPDFSSVGFRNYQSPGSNFGINLGYGLSKHWTLTGGLFFSNKRYTAQKSDYTSTISWPWYDQVGDIEALCRVIEMPVNVQYNFKKRDKHNFFLSGGLSSYWMKDEKYNYLDRNGDDRNWKWEVSNQNKHYLGVVNMSVGYRKLLNRHFSLQAEPYLKVPLAGVGAGKIKLFSSGVLFSLRYQFR
ncbi:MAG: hypothetical protein H7Y04_01425 [Verrucomicrobia bacterium]|nr:hypothetical protein [Cytophagales bacterium]